MSAMAAVPPPPLAPVSPIDMSPMGSLSPSRPISPARYSSPPKRSPERESPAPVNPLQAACSPANTGVVGHQRPPSPAGEAPQSSGSASSSSDSGSDSGSDSSDDSEDEDDRGASAPPPAKGPSTPPLVSPKLENVVEEPPPAVEESKRRWDLSSFFNKTAVQHGEQNSESKPAQVIEDIND